MIEKTYVIDSKTYKTDGKTITITGAGFILSMTGTAPFSFGAPTIRDLIKIRKYYPEDMPADE